MTGPETGRGGTGTGAGRADATEPEAWAPRAAWVIVALFLLACLPPAIWQLLTANYDEARYTVAAAVMMATGDYVVPVNPWGGVRLLKPPLAYYYVVGGFAIFGQSVFAAKVFWLLSGAAILGLTWALARRIGATATGAAVAVAALAANLHFYRATLTHIPDIPMMLGLTLAMAGFARILAAREGEDPPPWAFYAAWIGIGWAFLAKGLLALVLLALSLALRLPGRGIRRPGRHETAAILIALVLGGWWYAAVAFREPELLVRQFLGDQVTGKAALDLARVAESFARNAVDLVIGFFPVALAAIPLSLATLRQRPRREVLYLLLWCAAVVVIFSFGNARTERYMLPAMPAVAALIGLGFSGLPGAEIARRAGRAVRLLLPVVAVVGLLTAGVVYAGETVAAAGAVLLGFAAVTFVLWRLDRLGRPGVSLPVLAILPVAAVLSIFPAYSYLGTPSATDLSIAAIEAHGIAPEEVAIVRRWQLLERIGLRRPPIEDYRFLDAPDPEALATARLVVTTDPEAVAALEALGFSMRETLGAPGDYPLGDLLAAIRARDLGALRERWGERLWIGLRD